MSSAAQPTRAPARAGAGTGREGPVLVRPKDVVEMDMNAGKLLEALHLGLGTAPDSVRIGQDVLWHVFQEKCQGIVAGPPCPPWSGLGQKGGRSDPRARVLMSLLNEIKKKAESKTLKFFILENVVGWLHKDKVLKASMVEEVIDWLKNNVPSFMCQVFGSGGSKRGDGASPRRPPQEGPERAYKPNVFKQRELP